MRTATNNLAHNGMEEKNHLTNNSSGCGKAALLTPSVDQTLKIVIRISDNCPLLNSWR
jgi:hypothetical protein